MDIARMQTRLDPAWIKKVAADYPATLMPSGNVRVFGRGSFVNAASPGDDKVENGVMKKGTYGMSVLFTPDYDLKALRDLRAEKLKEFFPKNPTGAGLSDPIKDQAINVSPEEGGKHKTGKTFAGFVPGCEFIGPNANLDYRPTLSWYKDGKVEAAFGTQEELDAAFYSGAWYMVTVSCFHGRNPQNPNAFYGLSSVCKIMDDNRLGGGSGEGTAPFEGLSIDVAGVDPKSLF